MTSNAPSSAPVAGAAPAGVLLLLAIACGAIVGNLYYAQPLLDEIRSATGISPQAAGLIVTLSQVGYGLGLLFVVPLADLIENRRLITVSLVICTVSLVSAAASTQATQFLAAAFVIGLSSVSIQMLVPYAAHLSAPELRGAAVGKVMSGLLLGILLARPLSSLIADQFGWHAVYRFSAVVCASFCLILGRLLPVRQPRSDLAYPALIRSMWVLWRDTPILRRRGLYHAALFASFSLFWTVITLLLTGPVHHLSQRGVALFALVGVTGAVAAPIAGRMADRGFARQGTCAAIVAVIAAFALTLLGLRDSAFSLGALLVAAVLLDFGVSANLVIGQRAIFELAAEIRSRLNGLYMAAFFSGGALGSAVGVWAYAHGGWPMAAAFGMLFPCLALAYFATESGRWWSAPAR